MGAPPLFVTLSTLSAESRELVAAKLLTVEAARAAATAAALLGLNAATLLVGPANLSSTKAAEALQKALKGFSFEWVEKVERDGQKAWELRLVWPVDVPAPPSAA